jgi:hypothetical protein
MTRAFLVAERRLDAGEALSYPVALTAVAPTASGISVRVVRGHPPEGAVLEVYEKLGRPPLLRAKVVPSPGGLSADARSLSETCRFAGLVSAKGVAVSNVVGLTWPEVATVQSSSGIHARTEAAIVAMHDGALLGTVLFELLDQVRDFEVFRARAPITKSAEERGDEAEQTRPTESFYTDVPPEDESFASTYTGDRTDLDLLAALVQPLSPVGQRKRAAPDEEEEADDPVLAEEAERREIDEKGRATGQEGRSSPSLTSREALERASKRFARRLDRAAGALETALQDRQILASVTPRAVARQIWMAYIAGFLSGREAPTSDGPPVLCLEPLSFAEYILRACRAFAGGKEGGLFHLLPADDLADHDGESLKRGLSFVWTCVICAVDEILNYWAKSPTNVDGEDGEVEYAYDVWDACPELVAARFVLAVRPYCSKPDLGNIARRLPAYGMLKATGFNDLKRRIDHLADYIEKTEKAIKSLSEILSSSGPLKAGNLVVNPYLGVTVLAATGDNGKCYLVDFSRSDAEHPRKALRVFRPEQVKKASLPSGVAEPVWHLPGWLAVGSSA